MKHKSDKYTLISLLFVLVLSAGAVFAGFYFKKKGEESYTYFFGIAAGAGTVVLAQVFRYLKMLKNSKYRKEQEIAQKDERLISLRNRSMAVSYYATVIGVAAASIISAVKGDIGSAEGFSMILSLSAVVYFVAYLILSHKE